jgi:hypothetical protein
LAFNVVLPLSVTVKISFRGYTRVTGASVAGERFLQKKHPPGLAPALPSGVTPDFFCHPSPTTGLKLDTPISEASLKNIVFIGCAACDIGNTLCRTHR